MEKRWVLSREEMSRLQTSFENFIIHFCEQRNIDHKHWGFRTALGFNILSDVIGGLKDFNPPNFEKVKTLMHKDFENLWKRDSSKSET